MDKELLTLHEAAVVFETTSEALLQLIARHSFQPAVYMARPFNPSGVGRPVIAYRRADLEAALAEDAEERLG